MPIAAVSVIAASATYIIVLLDTIVNWCHILLFLCIFLAKWRLFEFVKQPSKMSSSLAALCRKRNTLNSVPVSLMLGHRRVSIKSLSNVISLEPAVFDSI